MAVEVQVPLRLLWEVLKQGASIEPLHGRISPQSFVKGLPNTSGFQAVTLAGKLHGVLVRSPLMDIGST